MRWSADGSLRIVALAASVVAIAGCGAQPAAPLAPVGRSAPPTAVHTPPPDYPEALACAGIGGTVQLRVRIDPDGHIRQTEVQQGSGNAELDGVARKAVLAWTFNPALQGGKPTAQWIAVPMTFQVPQPRPERCFALDEQQSDGLKKP